MIAAITDNLMPGANVIVRVNQVETTVEFMRWSDKYPGYAVVRNKDGKQKVRRVLREDSSAVDSENLPTDFTSFLRDSYHVNLLIEGEYHHIRADHYGMEFVSNGEKLSLRGVVGDRHIVGVDHMGNPSIHPSSMLNTAMAAVVVSKRDDVWTFSL